MLSQCAALAVKVFFMLGAIKLPINEQAFTSEKAWIMRGGTLQPTGVIKVRNRGIKHDFTFINICKVPREVLKTKGEGSVENRGRSPRFSTSQGTL